MKHFEILEHTADIRLKFTGSTFEELLQAALLGMASIIKPDHQKLPSTPKEIQKKIIVQSPDQIALLVDFLSDVLTQTHINKALFDTVSFQQLDTQNLQATIVGKPVDIFDEDIKAVTYHEAYINQQKNGSLEAQIIFDI
jgi:SHS2 domain-containing protein